MKLTLPVLLVAALLASGCREGARHSAESDDATHIAPEFSAKNGLTLPEATRRALGLKIVDVTEQKVAATIEVQLRVYESTGDGARATGLLSPDEASQLTVGQPLKVSVPNGRVFSGEVLAVNEQLQKATGHVEVLVSIHDADGALDMGTFAQGVFTLDASAEVVTIPRTALLKCSEGEFVYTVSGEHLVRTAVKVGAMNSERVEITDGLYSGDQVAAQPVMSLWLTELAAIKGGQACCIELPKGK